MVSALGGITYLIYDSKNELIIIWGVLLDLIPLLHLQLQPQVIQYEWTPPQHYILLYPVVLNYYISWKTYFSYHHLSLYISST